MNTQTTDTVLMIEPTSFAYNEQTALTNDFQQKNISNTLTDTAIIEFNTMVTRLRQENIRVVTLPNRHNTLTPDAVFPNNWFTVHKNEHHTSQLMLYPLLTENRRLEIQEHELKNSLAQHQIIIAETIDWRGDYSQILEGTGSLVFDHQYQLAFAALSPRTHQALVHRVCEKLNYQPIIFQTNTLKNPIYHTNVIVSIGEQFAVICSEVISNHKAEVLNALAKTQKIIIDISYQQLKHMCGNILQVHNLAGQFKIILSQTAYQHFQPAQLQQLAQFGELIPVTIPTIESVGGGSARCMLAEIFY
ncbi:MAG: hypothetical protein KIT27_08830 [Legionellales bacterium]|nr:hypothetical protein [Legionellales bacterium]